MTPERTNKAPEVKEAYNGNWNLKDLLGEIIESTADTEPAKRDYVYASDFGKPYLIRYLEMTGVPYSDFDTPSGLRAMVLGKQIELGIKHMLVDAGIAHRSNDRHVIKTPGCLDVVVKPDFYIEVTDWDKTLADINAMLSALAEEPEKKHELERKRKLIDLVEKWRKRYPNGLKPTAFECKAYNSNSYKYKQREGIATACDTAILQLYTGMKAMKVAEGHLLVVNRDWLDMEEVPVFIEPKYDEVWLRDLQTMTRFYQAGQLPPLTYDTCYGVKDWWDKYSRHRTHIKQLRENPPQPEPTPAAEPPQEPQPVIKEQPPIKEEAKDEFPF